MGIARRHVATEPTLGTHQYRKYREGLQARIERGNRIAVEARKEAERLSTLVAQLTNEQRALEKKYNRRDTIFVGIGDGQDHPSVAEARQRRAETEAGLQRARKAQQDAESDAKQAKQELRNLILQNELGAAPGRLQERWTRVVQVGLTVSAALAASLVTLMQRGGFDEHGIQGAALFRGAVSAGLSILAGVLYFLPELIIDAADARDYRRGKPADDSKTYQWSDKIRYIHYGLLAMQALFLLFALWIQVQTLRQIAGSGGGP